MGENKMPKGVNRRIDQLEKQLKLYELIDTELTQGINPYRFIVENSHIGIFIIDDNHTIVYGKNELLNIMGYSLDEIIGSDFRDYIAVANKDQVIDLLQQKTERRDSSFSV
ncbi:MAG: PAS domain S-box protein [Desulfobacterales bacterium]|nr:PAS domain S-box protein [Desulfobacterales bacterium]